MSSAGALSGIITFAIGGFALLSWSMGVRFPIQVRADYWPMAPITAVALLFVGMGLCAVAVLRAARPGLFDVVVAPAAIVALVVAGAALAQHGLDFGGRVADWQPPLLRPGAVPRLSPPSMLVAFWLALVGVALLAFGTRLLTRRVATGIAALGFGSCGAGLACLLAYCYGLAFLYRDGWVGLSVPTALAMVAIGAGLLVGAAEALPSDWFMVRERRVHRLSYVAGAAILVALIEGWLRLGLGDSAQANPALSGALAVLAAATIIGIWARSNLARIERYAQWEAGVETELRLRSEQLRGLLDVIDDGVLLISPEGLIERANPAAERILGLPADEITGRSYDDAALRIRAVDGRDPVEGAIPFEQVMAAGRPSFGIERAVGVVGYERLVALGLAPLRGRSGEPRGAVAVLRDVTLQRSAEEGLRESEARYRRLVGSSCDATIVERDGKVIYANPASARLLGASSTRQLCGGSLLDFVHDDHRETARAWLAGLRSEPRAASLDFDLTRLDGSLAHVQASAVGITLSGGAATIFVIRDLTQQRRLEQELERQMARDPLTELFSRPRFEEVLELELARTRRYGTPGALILLDIEGFGKINEMLGRAAGDELLVWLAQSLRRCLRESDVVGRWGSDEFALLLPNATREQACMVVTSLFDRLRERELRDESGWQVAARVGIALFPQHGVTTAALMTSVEVALRDAKTDSRGGFCFFGDRTAADD